jgi:hypothetical protein
LAAAAPEQLVEGNEPAALVAVYAVTQVGCLVNTALVSPLKKVPKMGVMVGTGEPKITVGLDAVMVSGAGLTTILCCTWAAAV